MIGLIDVENVLTGYDLKVGKMEIRRTVSAYGPGYILYHNGDGVSTSADLGKLWNLMTAEIDAESVEVVSLSPYERNKRFTPGIWVDAPDYDPDAEREPDERYDRNKETVSDILPDYRITIGDLYECQAAYESDDQEAWERQFSEMVSPDNLQYAFIRDDAFIHKYYREHGCYPSDDELNTFFDNEPDETWQGILENESEEFNKMDKAIKKQEDADYKKTMNQYGTMVDHI